MPETKRSPKPDALYQGEETCASLRSLLATYALLCLFTMSVLIENPAACEIRSVICFLNAKKVKPIKIYRQICEVYGQNVDEWFNGEKMGPTVQWRTFLKDNARPHTANVTRNLLQGFGWDVFDHPPFSPDLAPSDFHLFLHLKSLLGGQHFNSDEELKENVSIWLKTQAVTFYEEGIEKLVSRYDKCLQNFGSYVEK